ncbi:hypothetical protein NP233_g7724 [Leucocoprinus birnbaumii]|uniref:F-box domain-containing protein n=1 Tax=Leucocoprinus birnbaumii TaxID=56174 RepID=A0AAD5VNM8_9AGAR|nr:hypothetical protein NP233_g7724 [Leucocoprinus birnbaumii]
MISQEVCARCGFRSTTNHSSSRERDIPELTREIQQIDDITLRLKARKATASTQLNAMRTSTSILLDEVLSAILDFATNPHDKPTNISAEVPPLTEFLVDKNEYYCPLLVLGAVCSRWRQVAWSTPALWSTLSLDLTYQGPWEHEISLPRSYFINSRSQPMEILIDCRKY